MADRGSYGIRPRLDIQQLFLEAQHRWLRPAEICEILRNYQKFRIASEPPNRPSSGSLFLFDRKVLRYFRKDGHNWRKKKDGKTVKEAHEKLKVGSIDVLHCYYAHGEDNESFQRRSYWMLEPELMHIVFVHYLEVKGTRTNNSPSNSFASNHNNEPSGNTDSTSPTSTLSSLYEDSDSADSHQSSSRYQSFLESRQKQNASVTDNVNPGLLSSQFLHPSSGQSAVPGAGPISYVHGDRLGNNDNVAHIMDSQSLPSWEEVLEQCTAGYNGVGSHLPRNTIQPGASGIGGENIILSETLTDGNAAKKEFDGSLPIQSNWQIPSESSSLHFPVHTSDMALTYDVSTSLLGQTTHDVNAQNALVSGFTGSVQQNEQLVLDNLQMQPTNVGLQQAMHSYSESDMSGEGNSNHSFIVRKPLLDGDESLKKVDSFSRWISRELGEVEDLNTKSSSGIAWSTDECGNVVDDSSLSPSISQDQLFSIIDFSPKWAYTDSETEVHITGTFLTSAETVAKRNWSCMFGEVEVPAEVLADGILCCYAPPLNVATVPFYVTCSDRLACSELREFDYQVGSTNGVDIKDVYNSENETHLHLRFERLLSLRSSSPSNNLFDGADEKQKLINKIISLKEEGESYQMAERNSEKQLSEDEVKKHLVDDMMKDKFYSWLLHKISESGRGLTELDDDGQGVLHLAAALGCYWAIKPIMTAGLSINFRDVNGWTALHWAAFYGREQTVVVLISLGAASGALTDPSPEFPWGRTAADLASGNGHKGISGFLAESTLTSYLSSLTVNDSREDGALESSGTKAVQTISERTATPVNGADAPDMLSLKDSLTAFCNATQAANRIHQVFRMQSFQRKQLAASGDDFGISNERALSLMASRTGKPVHPEGITHAAAVQIQKKFRGWKKRKEFLIIRQRIVKIQAHVRGHQVRKQYKTFVWSVGILEKVILRWRRKGSGLRGFRRDALTTESNSQCMPLEEDDYDFLKEGRKQTEERTQIALTRVKSMYHNPEGRAQYRRLLTVFEGFRENKEPDMVESCPQEHAGGDEELIDIDSLLDDETFMSIAFE